MLFRMRLNKENKSISLNNGSAATKFSNEEKLLEGTGITQN